MDSTSFGQKVFLLGGGGHATVVADVVANSALSKNYVAGIFDNFLPMGKDKLGVPVLGPLSDWKEYKEQGNFIIAIGDNQLRSKVASSMESKYFETVIHSSAVIGKNVQVGAGTVIMPGVVINANVSIGCHVIINSGAVIEHDCIIRDFSHVSPNATLCGNVDIGKMVWIGAGATIIPKVKVNDRVTIGAGAVVVSEIQEKGTYIGCPAKRL